MNARPSPNWELPIEEQIDRIHTFLAPKPDLRDAYDVLIARLDIAANKRAVEEFKEAGEYAGLRQQLDCAYWIFQRMEAAFQLGLHKGERLNILDLNMRGGQFAFVCQAFGHRVQGLDSNHVVYKRIGEILGIERIEYPIRYREFIPPFRQKFDLITALQGQFDYISGGTYWEIADWEWFLHYLIATHCQAPGRIHFTLIRGVNPTTGETLPKDAPAAAFSRFGGTSDAASGVMHLSFDEALLERIRSGGGRRPNLSRVNAESAADAAAPPNRSCRGVYAIFGNSYSGSTLLNALLGSHPDIAGGGELHWLTSDPKEAMCSICGEGCPIWTSERRQHASLVNLYDLTAEAFDRPLVADASKMPDWFNKILPLCEEAHLPIRRILLVKHPVRHVASYLEKARRFNHLRQYRSVEAVLTALQNWYLYAFRSNRFDRIIKYEELATAPQAVVADALGLFGLDYRPQIDDWQSQPHHHVGGNAGPRTQIARHLLPAGEFLREKYRRDGVFLDDSYHDVLSTEEIEGIQCSPAARFIREIFGYSLDPSQPMSTLGT